MTSKTKTEFLSFVIETSRARGTAALESKDLVKKFPLTPDEMDYLFNEFYKRGFLSDLSGGTMDSGFLFIYSTTPVAEEFINKGGFHEEELNQRKRQQLDLDVANASIRSADAAEASALSSEKSAVEAQRSRNIAIFAALIALAAIVQQCFKT